MFRLCFILLFLLHSGEYFVRVCCLTVSFEWQPGLLGNANVTPAARLAIDVTKERHLRQRALAVALFRQVNVPKVALYDGLPASAVPNICVFRLFYL